MVEGTLMQRDNKAKNEIFALNDYFTDKTFRNTFRPDIL